MQKFLLFFLCIPLSLLLLTNCAAESSSTHVEQVQAPGVYPKNTYTAAYTWTQTTVDPSKHTSQTSTDSKIVSSDGKGHLIFRLPGISNTIQIYDLPAGQFYKRSKYPHPVPKNSALTYSGVSYLNEVMFTNDTDIFNAVVGMPRDPAPKSIGSKSIGNYQCEGWRRITDYKIQEWWFDKQSKCLVLMESKPNPKMSLQGAAMEKTLSALFGADPPQISMTERLTKLSAEPMPASWFDSSGLSPVKITVWKAMDGPRLSIPEPDFSKIYPPSASTPKTPLPPLEPGWKRVEWNATGDYGGSSGWFHQDIRYSVDIPENCDLYASEGYAQIETHSDPNNPSANLATRVGLKYYGNKAFRMAYLDSMHAAMNKDKAFRQRVIDSDDRVNDDPYAVGAYWPDARKQLDYRVKQDSLRDYSYKTMKVLSTKIIPQDIGGISFWRADTNVQVDNLVKHEMVDHCIMLSDEGIDINFESTPITEKIVASLRRK